MQDYQAFIERSLQEAAAIASRYFGNVTSTVKIGDNNQVLTQADLEVGKMLVARITQAFPTHNVIDEETGVIDNQSDYTWVVDPIDGTSNFASGLPLYAILVGLLKDGEPIAGGMALPGMEQLYVAVRGGGAYCNGQKVHVSTESSLLNALVAYGIDGHQEEPRITYDETKTLAEIILQIRNLRSSNSAYDFAQVARGTYGANLNRTSKIWDNVAPQMIIEEAGGVFTDFFGHPMDYSDPLRRADQNFTACTGSPELHDQLQRIIHAE